MASPLSWSCGSSPTERDRPAERLGEYRAEGNPEQRGLNSASEPAEHVLARPGVGRHGCPSAPRRFRSLWRYLPTSGIALEHARAQAAVARQIQPSLRAAGARRLPWRAKYNLVAWCRCAQATTPCTGKPHSGISSTSLGPSSDHQVSNPGRGSEDQPLGRDQAPEGRVVSARHAGTRNLEPAKALRSGSEIRTREPRRQPVHNCFTCNGLLAQSECIRGYRPHWGHGAM